MATLNFEVIPSDVSKPLGLEVWLDDQQISNYDTVTQTQTISCVFDDDVEQLHCVKIVVKNKTQEHTTVNELGEILTDSLFDINKFVLDGIEIDHIVQQKAVYIHDFNGTKPQVNDKFYNNAGCNGTIIFEFNSPIYLWLLENM